MSFNQIENDLGESKSNEKQQENYALSAEEMDTKNTEKLESEFHLASETVDVTPQSPKSEGTSSEIFNSPREKQQNPGRIARFKNTKPSTSNTPIKRPISLSSRLPVKNSRPTKIPSLLENTNPANKNSSSPLPRATTLNKHTLEMQLLNKQKTYKLLKKELLEKQVPLIALYNKMVDVKKRLEVLGKSVELEEFKFVSFEDYYKEQKSHTDSDGGCGEQISKEVIGGMKSSIEQIPKTLKDIGKNLLSRRALIVELLESVAKSEIDVKDVLDKIESLKYEGEQLEESLDSVILEHEIKISELVDTWQKLLNDKQEFNKENRLNELEKKLKEQEKLREESTTIIDELHRKLDDGKMSHEKSITELNGVLQSLRDQIKKLEQELDAEKKAAGDIRIRNTNHIQNGKLLKARITDLENEKTEVETANADLKKKIKQLQEQLKNKEQNWAKEKEELTKSLKHQENLLQKLTADKNQFETRLRTVNREKIDIQEKLGTTITSMATQLEATMNRLKAVEAEKDDAVKKYSEIENYIAQMNTKFKTEIQKVVYSIQLGNHEVVISEAEKYMQGMAKDLCVNKIEDNIHESKSKQETQYQQYPEQRNILTQLRMELDKQRELVLTSKTLLEQSENKLKQKATELEKLQADIGQLKVRQGSIEEQNNCTIREFEQMLKESQQKLTDLLKRSKESEVQLKEYKATIHKQTIQMNEMENLLRYRENMTHVLKTARNELLLEKESLTRYSREIRAALTEVTNQNSVKEKLVQQLQEKIALRESQMFNLEREAHNFEEQLKLTNAKRYKLQETVSELEKELQRTRAKLSQIFDVRDKQSPSWRFLHS
ncbi:hypothetical protein ABEB36_006149 [Hypothenemus hampei]